MRVKVTILFPILLGIFTSSTISEKQIEIDTETENIEKHENGPNKINLSRHTNYCKNKRRSEYERKEDGFNPKIIRKIMAKRNPFQTETTPAYYSFATSQESVQSQLDLVKERYFDQLIDHNEKFAGTFKQRYFVYNEFCQYDLEHGIHSRHPQVFAEFGPEAPSSKDDFFYDGFFMDDAKKHNACCVILEHRQYGNSTIGKHASVKYLELLRTDQVLDDMARFIKFFNYEYKIKYKRWAFYGCSLVGEYVSRFSVRHPEVYEFGIAAGACRKTNYDFYQYYDTIGDVLGAISPKCRRIVTEAFDSVTKLVREARSGYCVKGYPSHHCDVAKRNTKILEKYLQLCGKFNIFEEIDTQSMIYGSTNHLTFLIQYNLVGNNLLGVTAQEFCQDINSLPTKNKPHDSLRKFYEANCKLAKQLYGLTLDPTDPNFEPCENLCFTEIDWPVEMEFYRQTNWTAKANALGYRQWAWQVCQSVVNFVTTSGPNSAFGRLMSTFLHQIRCDVYFENRFNYVAERLTVSENNKLYGGLKGIPGSCPSCTLFVTHGRDPWKGCQMLHPHDITCGGYDNKFVLHTNGSHCATAYPDNFDDPDDGNLKEAKREIHGAIDHWMTKGCKHRTPVQSPV